jgi:hypothetical protein
MALVSTVDQEHVGIADPRNPPLLAIDGSAVSSTSDTRPEKCCHAGSAAINRRDRTAHRVSPLCSRDDQRVRLLHRLFEHLHEDRMSKSFTCDLVF